MLAAHTIQHAIDKRGYTSYLELGCQMDGTFGFVRCARKVGVDHDAGGTHRMTTDTYFEGFRDCFDIIFVDACHEHHQVWRDVGHALARLNTGGLIVMHDCLPDDRNHENLPLSGTVWRTIPRLRMDPGLDVIVGRYDHGVGLVRRGSNQALLHDIPPMDALTYEDLGAHLDDWMNLRSWDEVKAWI